MSLDLSGTLMRLFNMWRRSFQMDSHTQSMAASILTQRPSGKQPCNMAYAFDDALEEFLASGWTCAPRTLNQSSLFKPLPLALQEVPNILLLSHLHPPSPLPYPDFALTDSAGGHAYGKLCPWSVGSAELAAESEADFLSSEKRSKNDFALWKVNEMRPFGRYEAWPQRMTRPVREFHKDQSCFL